MTNVIASVVVALSTVTNWTGVMVQERELGVVLTNHVAVVEYRGKRTEVVLLTELGEVAVWREVIVFRDVGGTNDWRMMVPLYQEEPMSERWKRKGWTNSWRQRDPILTPWTTNGWITNMNLNMTNWIGI